MISGILGSFSQNNPFNENVTCRVKIHTTELGFVEKSYTVLNEDLQAVAEGKSKTTWDELDICSLLSSQTGYVITLYPTP